jgi:hypothetical protein
MATNEVTPEFNKQSGADFDYYADISSLHATQLRVGYKEIEEKRKDLVDKAAKGKLQEYLESKAVVVVLGPPGLTDTAPFQSLMEMADNISQQNKNAGKNKPAKPQSLPAANFDLKATIFVVDHHHGTLAAKEAGCTTVPIKKLHDFSNLTIAEFWRKMWDENLLNFNNNGPAGSFDDPFRSLARSVRKAGGYGKADTLYEEFLWANFFREHMDQEFVVKNYDKAVKDAVKLAKSADAKGLPGYIGVPVAKQAPVISPVVSKKKASKTAKPLTK